VRDLQVDKDSVSEPHFSGNPRKFVILAGTQLLTGSAQCLPDSAPGYDLGIPHSHGAANAQTCAPR
jgi:hypothetical protein